MAAVSCALGQTIDYPCVPNYRADPAYIKISEASGGQLFLFQKGEIGNPITGLLLARGQDPVLLRASGTLAAGTREFTAPVDPSVASLAATVFAECAKVAAILGPSGQEIAGEKFKSGRVALIDAPQPGLWRLRVAGTGYFTVSLQAKTKIHWLPRIREPDQLEVSLPDSIAGAQIKILARDGSELSSIPLQGEGAEYSLKFRRPSAPFRIGIEAVDSDGNTIRRLHAPLLEP